jgi:hypothetical protein
MWEIPQISGTSHSFHGYPTDFRDIPELLGNPTDFGEVQELLGISQNMSQG